MKPGLKKAAIVIMGMTLVPIAFVVIGCGGGATPTAAGLADAYTSSNLPAGYEEALPAATQLALGTFLLEGTPNAITPEQAQGLLPLWKALQGGAAQTSSEVNAVLGQIERAMTPGQLQAIAALRLTRQDLATWVQERGGNGLPAGAGAPSEGMPNRTPGPWPRGTPGAGFPGGGSSGARQTQRAAYDSLSEEERAQLMATMQAGGAPGSGFGGRAGQSGSDAGQIRLLLVPLIELLTRRAGS